MKSQPPHKHLSANQKVSAMVLRADWQGFWRTTMNRLLTYCLLLWLGLGLIVVLASWRAHLGFHNGLVTILALAAAVLPISLGLVETAFRNRVDTYTKHNSLVALRCALLGSGAETIVVLVGFVLLWQLHIEPAITAMQILAVEIMVLLPIIMVSQDKLQLTSANEKSAVPISLVIQKLVAFGALAAGLSYANYLWFFSRHHLAIRYLSPRLPLYHQATSLTVLTVTLCLLVFLLIERCDHHRQLLSQHLWSNRNLSKAIGGSLFLMVNIIYNPLLQPLFATKALTITDWLTAILAALLFMAISLIQRHTRHHSRHAVLQLHHEIHGKA